MLIDQHQPLFVLERDVRAPKLDKRRNGSSWRGDFDQLIECDLCGELPGKSTCIPSLVGGEVIGSVLVRHEQRLTPVTSTASRTP